VPSTLSFGNAIAGQGGVPGEQPKEENTAPKPVTMGSRMMDFLPDESGWLGKFRLVQNRSNDYLIDREAQKTNSYTGIPGIHQQDQAITESMGTIYERTQEHLGTTDAMVIRTRRRLINAAKALAKDGTVPPGVDDPSVYHYRSGGVILPRSADWLDATRDLQKAFVSHTQEELYEHAAR
jgi:hypothetical protein